MDKKYYEKCHGCNKQLTLDEVDTNYNMFKIAYCDDCIKDKVKKPCCWKCSHHRTQPCENCGQIWD